MGLVQTTVKNSLKYRHVVGILFNSVRKARWPEWNVTLRKFLTILIHFNQLFENDLMLSCEKKTMVQHAIYNWIKRIVICWGKFYNQNLKMKMPQELFLL